MKLLQSRIIVDGIRLEGEDARRIVREAMREVRRKSPSRGWLPLLAQLIITAVICGFASWGLIMLGQAYFGRVPTSVIIGFSSALGCIVGVIWARQYLKHHHRELRGAMFELGYELCPACGYWLRGLPDDSKHCPECGADREPRADTNVVEEPP